MLLPDSVQSINYKFRRIRVRGERARTCCSQLDSLTGDIQFAREEVRTVDGLRGNLGCQAEFVGGLDLWTLDNPSGLSGLSGNDRFWVGLRGPIRGLERGMS